MTSEYCEHICVVYLYGSCARAQQSRFSDVDLFMCADRIDARIQRKLRIMVTPDNLSLPEVELKFGNAEELAVSNEIFYRNIGRDGKLLWHEKDKLL